MADEYILKDEVLNLIEHNDRVCHYADERYENVVYAIAQTICIVVADMPAADVQPIRRGRWEEVTDYGGWGDTHYRCSVCGEEWYLEDGNPKDNNMNFCPRCGARMIKDGDTNG